MGQAGSFPEYVTTSRISWSAPLASSARIVLVFGKASSHWPHGALPIIDIQLPALPFLVLMTPSTDVAAPPTLPLEPSSKERWLTGTSNVWPVARTKL